MTSPEEVHGLNSRPVPTLSPRRVAGTLAVATAGTLLFARVTLNARLIPAFAESIETIQFLSVVGLALATVALATATDDDIERVGLAFVGVFGVFATLVPAVTVAAVAAVTAGGAVAVERRWRRSGRSTDWHLFPVVAIMSAVGVSLLGSVGVEPATLWAVGSHLGLLGYAATPALLGHDRADWAFGGLVAATLVVVGTTAPFITGAVTLVAGGVVAASLLVVAVGLCGVVTTGSAALRQREWYPAVGAFLLVAGGIPSTMARALAVVLGVLFLLDPAGGVGT